MKHLLKNYILTFDNLIKFFLKAHNIDITEYTEDINIFDFEKTYPNRYIKGIDVYPYIYILYKMKQVNNRDLEYFLRYFHIMLSKVNNHNINIYEMELNDFLNKTLELYLNEEHILYLVVMIQYYFL